MGIHGSDILMVLGVALLAGAMIFFTLAWRTPAAFLGFFFWIHIEDLVRIRMGNLTLVFFVKTALFTAMLCGFAYGQLRKGESLWKGFPVLVPLGLFFGFAAVQAFNPEIQNPLQPLIGFHAQFMYIPMFLLAYHYFDRESRIRQFLLFIAMLTAFESLLTVPQLAFGPGWWYAIVGKPDTLEMFVGRAGAGRNQDFFRPSSIFSNAGRFYQYLSVVATVMTGALFYFRNKRDRIAAFCCFFCIVVGVFVTSGRTTMYLLVLTVAVFLILGFARHHLRLKFALANVLMVAALYWTLPTLLGRTTGFIRDLFVYPIVASGGPEASGGVLHRLYSYTASLDRAIGTKGWTGHGLGSNSLGLHFIGLRTEGEEPGYAALIWEYGVCGLLLWLLVMGLLWFKSFRAYREFQHSAQRPLALGIWLLVSFVFIYQYMGFQIMQNYLVTIHFWTFAAILFALQRLRLQEDETDGSRQQLDEF